jgi:hypothetical protein
VQRITIEEIRSNPGGNFDICRVIQTLPGVGGTAGSVGAFITTLSFVAVRQTKMCFI